MLKGKRTEVLLAIVVLLITIVATGCKHEPDEEQLYDMIVYEINQTGYDALQTHISEYDEDTITETQIDEVVTWFRANCNPTAKGVQRNKTKSEIRNYFLENTSAIQSELDNRLSRVDSLGKWAIIVRVDTTTYWVFLIDKL
jgi:hypothetical protein